MANANKANLPIFALGEYAKIQPAIDANILSYPAYVYVSDKKMMAFIDKDLNINLIVGDNKKQVVKVDVLPDIADGDVEVLYIYNGIVYVFDGTEYKPMYVDHTADLEAIRADIEALEGRVASVEEALTSIEVGESNVVFADYINFPEVGEDKHLYVDTTDEQGGIYFYDVEKSTYVRFVSKEVEGATEVKFVELDSVEL